MLREFLEERKRAKMEQKVDDIRFRVKDWWKYLIGIALLVIYLMPFYVVITVALKEKTDISSRLSFPFGRICWDNFRGVIEKGDIFMGIKNCLIVTGLVLVVLVVVGSTASYALQRNQTRLNNFIRTAIMGVMMITPLTILVGIYTTMSKIRGISTYWGIVLILSAFGLPLAIMLYTNFIAQIPKELDEAASIDGAGVVTTFFRVIFPQLKTITVTIIILQGVSTWNEFTFSNYFLQRAEMKTITLVIRSYFSSVTNDYGGAAAAACIGMLPLVIVYLCLQKYFIQGQMDGAVKG